MKWLAMLLSLFLFGCASSDERQLVRIGVDPGWHQLQLYGQDAYLNGFLEDLLMEIARYSGYKLERIQANWDTLQSDLLDGEYDLIISSLMPYLFYQDELRFSDTLLDLGPLLILPLNQHATTLQELDGHIVGFESRSAQLILQTYPNLIARSYDAPALLLEAVVKGEVDAALLDPLLAANYLRNLFPEQLHTAGPPLSQEGIRFIFDKEATHTPHLFDLFNRGLAQLKKQGKWEALQKKWHLRA